MYFPHRVNRGAYRSRCYANYCALAQVSVRDARFSSGSLRFASRSVAQVSVRSKFGSQKAWDQIDVGGDLWRQRQCWKMAGPKGYGGG